MSTESDLSRATVLKWAHVLSRQIIRLREDREATRLATNDMRATGVHTDRHSQPFYELEADKLFALAAARQLVRALRAHDDDLRLPPGLRASQVKLLRDALEHWNEPEGQANREMRRLGLDPTHHAWQGDGTGGVLGELIPDQLLEIWATDVYGGLNT